MRPVRLEEDSDHHTLLWVLAGTAVGVVAGILVAERVSGRKVTLRGLVERGRKLAAYAMSRGEELADAATQLREAWGASEEEDEDPDDERFDEGEGPEDADEMEAALDAEDAEEDEEEEEEEEEEDEGEEDAIDERVLEAFTNDPVLAQRAVEIESDGGVILLHGRVHTAREVQHAVTIARGVPGVIEVRQRLRVRPHR